MNTRAIDVVLKEGQQPIDILIGNEKCYHRAFWFLSRDWQNLHQLLAPAISQDIPSQIIYTQSKHSPQDELLKLTKEQIDHAWHSRRYDPHQRPNHGHLYFLDTEDATFHIYRGLVHSGKCRQYAAESHQAVPVSSLRIDEHAELHTDVDDEVWKQFTLSSEDANEVIDPSGTGEIRATSEADPFSLQAEKIRKKNVVKNSLDTFAKPLKCQHCGAVTTEWSQAQLGRGTYICNQCIGTRQKEDNDDYDW